MLSEIRNARQIPGEAKRRWFHSPEMDLIVWLDDRADDRPIAFQLCYDKLHGEKALGWSAERGFAHMDVDDGENTPGKHKGAPLLVPDGAFDGRTLRARFTLAAEALPEAIRAFVMEKMALAADASHDLSPAEPPCRPEIPDPC